MAFGTGNFEFNCIYGYSHALETWENTTPWRGEDQSSVRPLGYKRKRQHSIIKYDECIGLELYNTDVVTFHKDGGMTLATGGWDTQATRGFMNAAQHYPVLSHKGNTYVRVNGFEYRVPSEGIKIRDGIVCNPAQETYDRLNKAKAKIVRANLKPFMQYLNTMYAVSRGNFSSLTYENMPARNGALRATLEDMAEEGNVIGEEFLSEFFMKLMHETGAYNHPVLDTIKKRALGVVYQLSGAMEEVPVEIGFLPPRDRFKYIYVNFV
jgi:hypothetical protein